MAVVGISRRVVNPSFSIERARDLSVPSPSLMCHFLHAAKR